MSNKDLKFYFKELLEALSLQYPLHEAESIAYIVVKHLLNYSKFKYTAHKHDLFPDNLLEPWNKIKERLATGEPVQYVVKETYFYGLKFKVNPSVLIPRPETEELVDLIIKENTSGNLKLLDIGTGSGCIPVSIKANRKEWDIWAMDISSEAIKVAKENAENHLLSINFIVDDILLLHDINQVHFFDILVSNPPYVPYSEIKKMHKNVADFEPHIALFSPDEDPVKFYKAISEFATKHLQKNGKVYVEIHENYGNEVKEIFLEKGFTKVQVIADINSKPRIVKAER